MNAEKLYVIDGGSTFTPQIGHLVSMMEYTRYATTQLVSNLRTDQLDYLVDQRSNSIGALLLHIAAIEFAYQTWAFDKRE